MNLKRILIAVSLAAFATVSFGHGVAQRGFRWRTPSLVAANPTALLDRDDVRNDLKLTDDQRVKLDLLRDHIASQFRDLFSRMPIQTQEDNNQDADQQRAEQETRRRQIQALVKEATDEAEKIITSDQHARLQQIAVQLTGNTAALNPEIQKTLSLTSDQKGKIQDLAEKAGQATRMAWQKVGSGDITMDTAQATGEKNEHILADEIGKVLTEDQKNKLKDLSGKPFKADPVSEAG
jgi:hypothetical protein